MKMTNGAMFENIMILRGMHESGKLGYAIARNLRKMIDASKEYLDIRDGILKKYGTPTDNGDFSIPNENVDAFNKELSEYSTIEHDFDAFLISEDEFCSGSLDSQQMFVLDWMVKRDE